MKQFVLLFFIALLSIVSPKTQAQNEHSDVKLILIETRNNQRGFPPNKINFLQNTSISIPYDQNYLLFRFKNAIDSTQKSFEYKLLGLDYEWIRCNDCSEVRYAHLDGGVYTFQIKTLDSNKPITEFSFSIDQNIWYKWWFIPMLFLYALVLFGVGSYFYGLLKLREKLKRQRLIHQEKMKSMSELTAGIAHEIQNPLNFVNNFSELSVDLVKDLKEAIEKPEIDKEYVDDLFTDLSQNQEKINLHGKRASSIVKGMLEHSRTSTGVKELTDINKLADEYLRLSYHGLRAKDKTFNSDFKTDFDESLPKIEVISQDFGRVLLNLINNAFYAVSNHAHVETRHALSLQSQYQPTVIISTQKSDNQIIIKVKDNGTGMSEATKAKIFQPFFTTKPTGEGTGLGLSLAYDIVTNGHGGTLEVETKEGEGSTFIIKIPYI